MKYTYSIETFYIDRWMTIVKDGRDVCLGYLRAVENRAPRNAHRLVRSDGKITQSLPAAEDVSIGQVAGHPTAEQYEAAAQRALDQAARIRRQDAAQAARRHQLYPTIQ